MDNLSGRNLMVAVLSAFWCLGESLAAATALNPDVTPETIQRTICLKGYTKTIRPSTAYTNGIKFRLMRGAGIEESLANEYALDHIIALAIGGSPRSLDNLQLLTAKENSRKARIEVKLQCLVCAGQVPLDVAQEKMYTNWVATYWEYAGIKCIR